MRGRESTLVERAVAGDEAALTVLLTDSRLSLLDLITRKIPGELGRWISADDVVQEAHAQVFCRIDTFEDRGPESFLRWVATIALRRLRSELRRHRAAKRGGGRCVNQCIRRIDDSSIAMLDLLVGPGRTPSGSAARWEAVDAVQSALSRIPEQYRQALSLVHLEGYSVREAAEEMGRSERAVHSLCRRGLEHMRVLLKSSTKYFSSTG